MGNKKDKWFIVLVIALFFVMVMDVYLTWYGMNLGYSEGNPIIQYLFNTFGVTSVNIVYLFLTLFVCIGLVYIREKTTSENKIRFYYTLTGILMSIRIFFVGAWFGLLVDKINLGVPF